MSLLSPSGSEREHGRAEEAVNIGSLAFPNSFAEQHAVWLPKY